MEQKLEKILDECIAEIRRGKNLEECLLNYPQLSAELRPLLELSQSLEHFPKPEPTLGAISKALIGVGIDIASYRERRSQSIFARIFRQPKVAWALGPIFGILLLVSVTTIATSSVPGGVFYPVKLATEKVKFLLSFDAERKAELRLTFSDERLKEMTKLLQRTGALDENLLKSMLDEAKSALDDANRLPEQQAALFQVKFNHTNAYQKESLEQLRPKVPSPEQETVDKAIDVCRNRMQWMMKRMREGKHVPWERGCDMW